MQEQLIIYLIFNSTYYITSFILFCLDLYAPQFFYKIHDISRKDLLQIYYNIYPTVIFNVTILSAPFIYLNKYLINFQNREFTYFDLTWQILFNLVFIDIIFYIAHYILHYPPLYKWSHKKHHQIKTPVGFSALYDHWFDFITTALLPIYFGMFLISAHIYTVYLWTFIATFNTVVHAHGGIRNFSEFHDLHHQKINVNYGAGGWMDKLLGTYRDEEVKYI